MAQGLWAALLTLPVDRHRSTRRRGGRTYGNLYSQLLEYIIPVDLTFYALMVGAVIVMRIKAPGLDRPYRTLAYPVPPLIYIGLAVLAGARLRLPQPATSGIGFLHRPGGHPGLPDLAAGCSGRTGPGTRAGEPSRRANPEVGRPNR